MTLTAGEIAQMRSVIDNETLAGTAVIGRYTTVPDGQGGEIDTYANVGTADAHLSPLGGQEAEVAAQVAAQSQWVITLPALTDIDEKDRVTIAGRAFEIDAVRAPRTWELATRCYAHDTE